MIWVGLPAYNEGARIKRLLIEIDKNIGKKEDDYTIIVYDDGSSDDTAARVLAVREQGVKVQLIGGGINRGLGHALKSLILHFSRVSSFESLSSRLVVFKNSEITCDETDGPSASNDSLTGLFPRLDWSKI